MGQPKATKEAVNGGWSRTYKWRRRCRRIGPIDARGRYPFRINLVFLLVFLLLTARRSCSSLRFFRKEDCAEKIEVLKNVFAVFPRPTKC